jgi:predicted PhzF superfamily epimerase YddE/YHI9
MFKLFFEADSQPVGAAVAEHLVKNSHLKGIARLVCLTNNPRAWEDEDAGLVRARVFAPRVGVVEDEATGAHAVRLAARLGRRITIRQGKGSLIFAEPRPDGTVEIWGRTELVEVRKYEGASS